jgi:dihydroflavonol-4-reductase
MRSEGQNQDSGDAANVLKPLSATPHSALRIPHLNALRIPHFRRVGITGSTGFIGHHLTSLLRQQGVEVVALVRRSSKVERLVAMGAKPVVAALDDTESLVEACRGLDVLFHLAGAVDFNNDWSQCRSVNVEGTRNLLEAAKRSGVKRFLHASSIVSVGATPEPERLDETSSWNLGAYEVPYCTTKRQGEELALGVAEPEVIVVNPASVIGPDDFSGSEFGILCKRFWKGRVPIVFGGGNNFVDVRDVAQGILLAAIHGRAHERYILGGHNVSYTAFFHELSKAAGKSIPYIRVPTGLALLGAAIGDRLVRKHQKRPQLTSAQARLMGLFFYYDGSKAQRELGYSPRPLAESCRDAYRFWNPS